MTWNKIRLLVLTRVEAAEELGVAPPTLDEYRKRGILVPIASASGRVIAYSKEDIRKFKAKQSAAELYRRKPGPKGVRL
jgi:predicted site-specific integrase-resolvase